jgi:hypothetical protein
MELKETYDCVYCILVTEDGIHWPAILNMIFKEWAPKIAGKYLD